MARILEVDFNLNITDKTNKNTKIREFPHCLRFNTGLSLRQLITKQYTIANTITVFSIDLIYIGCNKPLSFSAMTIISISIEIVLEKKLPVRTVIYFTNNLKI